MRKAVVVLTTIFGVLGIVFTVLPLGTIALLPISIAILLAFIAIKMSEFKKKRYPKILLIVSVLTFLVVVGKEVFVKDVVVVDKKLELQKIESKKEDIKDLEGL